jgi:predicted MFS family arabinose efflux permease
MFVPFKEVLMSTTSTPADSPLDQATVSTLITLLLGTACGLIVANLYYAQPLVGPISASLGLSPEAAGLIVTMAQIGYVAGLLLIVPLGDLVENRKLVLCVIGVAALALFGAALATQPLQFLGAALLIGLGSVAVQILIPYAAHLAPEAARGRVVGNVTTGLMIGIMLARPASSFIASMSSWHSVYIFSGTTMVVLAMVLFTALPRRSPKAQISYSALLASMGHLFMTTPALRRRAFYQAFLFGAFSLFWTTIPLLLAGPAFHMSQRGIAWFALAGVAGAVAAPIAGRVADRGFSHAATGAAMLISALAFVLTEIGHTGSTTSLVLLVIAAILLDFGVQGNVVLGYRALFMLGAEYRSRLNGLYMATFFLAGAAGSGVGVWAFERGGWALTSWIGFALPVAALIYFATERRAV